MPTEVHTLCFHTRDAVERHDSSMTFELPSNRLRNGGAAKVALASCEFPMVQWTVEEAWNRLWLNEGVRLLGRDGDNVLRVAFRLPGAPESEEPLAVTLPPRLNPISRATRNADGAIVYECALPHGLWARGTGAPLRAAFAENGVRLVGRGDVSLSAALADGRLQWLSETSFALLGEGGDEQGAARGALYVWTATVPSPRDLCVWLTEAARGAFDAYGARLDFGYDAARDVIRLRAFVDVPGAFVRVLPGPLAAAMGLSTAPVRVEAHEARWPCESTAFWDYVAVPPGFYAPCHRPMCTGQPLRLGTELEAAVNRFYFPLSEGDAKHEDGTPHHLVFTDPEGRALTAPIPCGRYAPATLAAHLEAAMTRAAQPLSPGASYSVTRERGDRFVFACERRDPATGRVAPAAFGLLFHHPLSIDPARLGFAAQPLSGAHTYAAPEPTHAAVTGADGRGVANLLRFGEAGAQKRFRVHATHPPPMVGVVVAAGKPPAGAARARGGGDALVLRTHVNGLPFAHGFQYGDVVRLARSGPARVRRGGEDFDAAESAAALPPDFSCVVLEGDAADPCALRLGAPALEGLRDAGTALRVTCEGAEPFNLCFGKPRSLPAHLLGFRAGAVLWGLDGSVGDDGARRLPPFEAPHVHCLDHPDYVLLTFSEASGAALTHSYDGQHKEVFCKLSLYPLFREERMLPRDTTLANHGGMSRFTIAFWNPDLRTPYHFHGAEFSFSLGFYSAVPDA
jgi:hypothetical protein